MVNRLWEPQASRNTTTRAGLQYGQQSSSYTRSSQSPFCGCEGIFGSKEDRHMCDRHKCMLQEDYQDGEPGYDKKIDLLLQKLDTLKKEEAELSVAMQEISRRREIEKMQHLQRGASCPYPSPAYSSEVFNSQRHPIEAAKSEAIKQSIQSTSEEPKYPPPRVIRVPQRLKSAPSPINRKPWRYSYKSTPAVDPEDYRYPINCSYHFIHDHRPKQRSRSVSRANSASPALRNPQKTFTSQATETSPQLKTDIGNKSQRSANESAKIMNESSSPMDAKSPISSGNKNVINGQSSADNAYRIRENNPVRIYDNAGYKEYVDRLARKKREDLDGDSTPQPTLSELLQETQHPDLRYNWRGGERSQDNISSFGLEQFTPLQYSQPPPPPQSQSTHNPTVMFPNYLIGRNQFDQYRQPQFNIPPIPQYNPNMWNPSQYSYPYPGPVPSQYVPAIPHSGNTQRAGLTAGPEMKNWEDYSRIRSYPHDFASSSTPTFGGGSRPPRSKNDSDIYLNPRQRMGNPIRRSSSYQG